MKYFVYRNLIVDGKVLSQVIDENGKQLGVGETYESAMKNAGLEIKVERKEVIPNMEPQEYFDV